jgi:hypothetical protein
MGRGAQGVAHDVLDHGFEQDPIPQDLDRGVEVAGLQQPGGDGDATKAGLVVAAPHAGHDGIVQEHRVVVGSGSARRAGEPQEGEVREMPRVLVAGCGRMHGSLGLAAASDARVKCG